MSNKKESPRPADPVILKGPNAGNGEVIPLPDQPPQLRLQAFPDGNIFKVAVHPKEAETYVMFDVNKYPVAFFESPAIARLCCDAVRMLLAAVELQQKPKPGTPPEMLAGQPPIMES